MANKAYQMRMGVECGTNAINFNLLECQSHYVDMDV